MGTQFIHGSVAQCSFLYQNLSDAGERLTLLEDSPKITLRTSATRITSAWLKRQKIKLNRDPPKSYKICHKMDNRRESSADYSIVIKNWREWLRKLQTSKVQGNLFYLLQSVPSLPYAYRDLKSLHFRMYTTESPFQTLRRGLLQDWRHWES